MSDESVRRQVMGHHMEKAVEELENIVDRAAYDIERERNDRYLQGFADGERNLANLVNDILRTEVYNEVRLAKIERLVRDMRKAQRDE
jgi:hypothetical protein